MTTYIEKLRKIQNLQESQTKITFFDKNLLINLSKSINV